MADQLDRTLDYARLKRQLEVVRAVMLSASICGAWLTLEELAKITGYPPASFSADLRHLRKSRYGAYLVEKRRRGNRASGLWEYRVAAGKENAA